MWLAAAEDQTAGLCCVHGIRAGQAIEDRGHVSRAALWAGTFLAHLLILTVPVTNCLGRSLFRFHRQPFFDDTTLGLPLLHATACCALMSARLPPASVALRR
jgi:hypothetical protein